MPTFFLKNENFTGKTARESWGLIMRNFKGIIYEHIEDAQIWISDALHNLVPFVQFKKREKHQLKVILLHGCFPCFLNCTNGTKSSNAPN